MDLLLVKPAKDLKVRDPDTMLHLPADGMEVPDTSYWRRRLKAGDVTLVTPTVEQTQSLEKEE